MAFPASFCDEPIPAEWNEWHMLWGKWQCRLDWKEV